MEIDNKAMLNTNIASAFGINPEISLLRGGIDLRTFRSGNVVLRNLGEDAQEVANWQAELFSQIKRNGFRVAKPLRATNGSWMIDGWVAEEFLDGRHATKDDITVLIKAITNFHEALIGVPMPDYRKKESTIYDRADNWSWGEIPKDIDPNLYKLTMELAELRKPVDLPSQLIHGDLNLENVLVAENLPPAIIDFVPYWRPSEFALAVTAFWAGPYTGDLEILGKFKHIREFDQMLIRAGLRMMLTQKDPKNAKSVDSYRKTTEIIKKFVTSK